MPELMTCPTERDGDDTVARQWASGSMPPAQANEFEAHLLTCERCQEAVKSAPRFTVALRTAATEYREKQSRLSMMRWVMIAAAAAAAAAAAFLATRP